MGEWTQEQALSSAHVKQQRGGSRSGSWPRSSCWCPRTPRPSWRLWPRRRRLSTGCSWRRLRQGGIKLKQKLHSHR
ncbi:hypothetical protein HaLaN_18233, partial [Haematococcus lacustris]